MTQPLSAWIISVLLPDDALALNRLMGIVRRRNIGLESFSVGPADRPGMLRVTCCMNADRGAIDRSANAIRRMIGVREVTVTGERDCVSREHALIRVRVAPASVVYRL